jgi:hypothetical protein
MDVDVLKRTKECLKRQGTKNNIFLKKKPYQPIPQSNLPNQHIPIDLFGLCKTLDMGNKYILRMIDVFTKFAEIMLSQLKKQRLLQMK